MKRRGQTMMMRPIDYSVIKYNFDIILISIQMLKNNQESNFHLYVAGYFTYFYY